MSPASGALEPSASPNRSDSDSCASRPGPPGLVHGLGVILGSCLSGFLFVLLPYMNFKATTFGFFVNILNQSLMIFI